MVSRLRVEVDARRRKVDEILATIRHDITAMETNFEEAKVTVYQAYRSGCKRARWSCGLHEQRSCSHAKCEQLVTRAERVLVRYTHEEGQLKAADDREATWYGLTRAGSSLVISGGQPRASSQTVVVSERVQRRTSECEASIDQHYPLVGGRGQRHRCWRRRAGSDQHLPPRKRPLSAMEATWVSRTILSVQAPAWSWGAKEAQRCNAGWISWVTCTREATWRYRRRRSSRSIRQEYTHWGKRRMFEPFELRHHKSDARLFGAGWTCSGVRAWHQVGGWWCSRDGCIGRRVRKTAPKNWYQQQERQRDGEKQGVLPMTATVTPCPLSPLTRASVFGPSDVPPIIISNMRASFEFHIPDSNSRVGRSNSYADDGMYPSSDEVVLLYFTRKASPPLFAAAVDVSCVMSNEHWRKAAGSRRKLRPPLGIGRVLEGHWGV